jgi:hypothetical protein
MTHSLSSSGAEAAADDDVTHPLSSGPLLPLPRPGSTAQGLPQPAAIPAPFPAIADHAVLSLACGIICWRRLMSLPEQVSR